MDEKGWRYVELDGQQGLWTGGVPPGNLYYAYLPYVPRNEP
jgi:hypothetical protein